MSVVREEGNVKLCIIHSDRAPVYTVFACLLQGRKNKLAKTVEC